MEKDLKITIKINKDTKQLDVVNNELTSVKSNSDKLNGSLNNTTKELNTNATSSDKLKGSLSSTTTELNTTTNTNDKLGTSLLSTSNDFKSSTKSSEGFFNAIKGGTTNLLGLGVAISGISAIKGAMGAYGEFEDQMSRLKVTSGATTEEMEKLKAKAEEIAKTGKYNSTQVAEAMNGLNTAGLKSSQILDSVNDVITLSIAGQLDLKDATEISATAINQFGLEAKDMGRVADTMVASNILATLNVQDLGESFKNVAGVAKGYGMNIEEVSTILATLANNGIKGATGGEQLKMVLQRLGTNQEAKKTLDQLGISMYDTDGKTKNIIKVLEELSVKINDIDRDDIRMDFMTKIAGEEANNALKVTLGNINQIKDNLVDMYDQQGTSNKIAQGSTSDYTKSVQQLESSMYELKKAIGAELAPVMTSLAQNATELINGTREFITTNKDLMGYLVSLGAVYGTIKLASMAYNATIGELSTAKKQAIKQIILYDGALATTSLTTKGLTAVTEIFNATLRANPIGLVIGGVALLGGAVMSHTEILHKNNKEIQANTQATKEQTQANDAQAKSIATSTQTVQWHKQTINTYNNLIQDVVNNDKLSDEQKQKLILTYSKVIDKQNELIKEKTKAITTTKEQAKATDILTVSQQDFINSLDKELAQSKGAREQLEYEHKQKIKEANELFKTKSELSTALSKIEETYSIKKTKLLEDEKKHLQSKDDTTNKSLEATKKAKEEEERLHQKEIDTINHVDDIYSDYTLNKFEKLDKWADFEKRKIEESITTNEDRLNALSKIDEMYKDKKLSMQKDTYDGIQDMHDDYYLSESEKNEKWYSKQRENIDKNIQDETMRTNAIGKLDDVMAQKKMESYEKIFGMQSSLADSFEGVFTGKITSAGDFFKSFSDGIIDNFTKAAAQIAAQKIMMSFMNSWSGDGGKEGKGFVEDFLGVDIPFLTFNQGTVWGSGKYGIVDGVAPFSGDDIRNDTVPALISRGEAVIPRSAVEANKEIVISLIEGARANKYNQGYINDNQINDNGVANLMFGGIGKFVKKALSTVGKIVAPVLKPVMPILEPILKNPELGWLAQAGIALAPGGAALIPAMLTADLTSAGISLATGGSLKDAFKGAGLSGAIAGGAGAVSSLIKTGAMPVANQSVWEAINTYPDTLMSDISTKWTSIKDSFNSITDVSTVNESLGTKLSSITWEGTKDKFLSVGDKIADWGVQKFDVIKDYVLNPSKIFEKIAEGVPRILSNITTSISNVASNPLVSSLISHGLVSDKKPLNMQDLAVPFANGGIVTKPTLGLIGEAGYNEAIIPLKDNNSINLNTKTLEDKIDKVIELLVNLVDIKGINFEMLRLQKDISVDNKIKNYNFDTKYGGLAIDANATVSDKFGQLNQILAMAINK